MELAGSICTKPVLFTVFKIQLLQLVISAAVHLINMMILGCHDTKVLHMTILPFSEPSRSWLCKVNARRVVV